MQSQDNAEARILLVDDEIDNIQLLQLMLQNAGYRHIESTTQPRLAFESFLNFRPDIIVLDWMMPDWNGQMVMEQLRPFLESPILLPVLVLTADNSRTTRENALKAGAQDFVPKPFEATEFLLRFRNLVQVHLLHRNLFKQNLIVEEQKELLQRKVDDLRRSEEELVFSRQQLRNLSQRLWQAQESERRRIAADLHDEIGAALTAAKLNLHAVSRIAEDKTPVAPQTIHPLLNESLDIVERALGQVRQLSLDLRPSLLDDFGLVDTLIWYAERITQRAGLELHFNPQRWDDRLPDPIASACFRLAQEALTNVVRHAQARTLEMSLERTDTTLEIIICDDGLGFDVNEARHRATQGQSLGLLSLEERAKLLGGSCEIVSTIGHGTRICACFPLQPTFDMVVS